MAGLTDEQSVSRSENKGIAWEKAADGPILRRSSVVAARPSPRSSSDRSPPLTKSESLPAGCSGIRRKIRDLAAVLVTIQTSLYAVQSWGNFLFDPS